MTLEATLTAILLAQCPRTFPDVAPYDTPPPYVTWQHIGGQSLRYLDGSAADKRNTSIQINTWAATTKEAMELLRAIEDALCASTVLVAVPQGEPVPGHDDSDVLRGRIQDFSIWGAR